MYVALAVEGGGVNLFGRVKSSKEKYPDFIIKPNADGSWYITKIMFDGYGIDYRTVNAERYATIEEAKKAVENLQGEVVKIWNT